MVRRSKSCTVAGLAEIELPKIKIGHNLLFLDKIRADQTKEIVHAGSPKSDANCADDRSDEVLETRRHLSSMLPLPRPKAKINCEPGERSRGYR